MRSREQAIGKASMGIPMPRKGRKGFLSRLETVLIGVFLCFAVPRVEAQYGGMGGEFLRYGVGGRAMAMAGAFTGVSDGVDAIFYNPAGLAQIDQLQLGYMTSRLFFDTRYEYLALGYPTYDILSTGDKVVFGVGRIALGTKGLEAREAFTHRFLGEFADEQTAWIIPIAYDYVSETGRISFAAELNHVSHSISGYKASAFGYGFSLMYQPLNPPLFGLLGRLHLPIIGEPFSLENMLKWRVGVLFRSLPTLTLYREPENLPDLLRVGASFSTPVLDNRAWAVYSMQMGWFGQGGSRNSAGIEIGTVLWRGVRAAIRFGKRFGLAGSNRGLTFGLGLASGEVTSRKLPLSGQFSLDYVHDTHAVLGGVDGFFVTLGLLSRYEDVEAIQLTNGGKKYPEPTLRRILTWHPRDTRRVGLDSLRVAIDSKYRDGSESGDSTGIAELLLVAAESRGDSGLVDRYDDFVGGFKRLTQRTLACLRSWRTSLGQNNLCLASVRRDWVRKETKLARGHNAPALDTYLNYLLTAGDTERGLGVVNRIATKNPKLARQRLQFYRALLRKDPSEIRETIPNVSDSTLRLYLRFLAAALEHNVDSLSAVAATEKAQWYAFDKIPPAPLLSDGMIADDATLLAVLYGNSGDAELKNGFLRVLLRYPNSDAAMLIGTRKTKLRSRDGILRLAGELRRFYESQLRPGGIIRGVSLH